MDPHRRYWHGEIGFNYRITNMQAALGVAQLERLDEFLQRKREIAATYRTGLQEIPGVSLQEEAEWASSACWMTTLRIDGSRIDRDELAGSPPRGRSRYPSCLRAVAPAPASASRGRTAGCRSDRK